MRKPKRMVLATAATAAVAIAGTWGAVAMAASPGSTTPKSTPKSQTTPKSQSAPSTGHKCPNMGSSSGTSSSTMYSPSNV